VDKKITVAATTTNNNKLLLCKNIAKITRTTTTKIAFFKIMVNNVCKIIQHVFLKLNV